MENNKTNIDNNRIKCDELLLQINKMDSKLETEEYEKNLLKLCRKAENVYRKTYLNKDSQRLMDYYLLTIKFYEENQNFDLLQRWHQKLIGIMEQAFGNRFVLNDYHILMEWYVKTLDLMLSNKDFEGMIKLANNMNQKAKYLYKATKTNEDLKFYVISKLMLGTGYYNLDKLFKSYSCYYNASSILKKLYTESKDEGIKNDLISIYECLYDISNRHIFKFIAKRWKVKILLLKEE